eukprot:753557-Hanusia_phi.AAC.2
MERGRRTERGIGRRRRKDRDIARQEGKGTDRGLFSFAAIGFALIAAIVLVSIGSVERDGQGRRELLSTRHKASRRMTVLKIAKQLHAKNVPLKVSLKAASAMATLTSLCGGADESNQEAMNKYRQRVDKNWWSAIRAFTTEEEVKKMVMADTRHAHVLIFVAPGWCQWSQKQVGTQMAMLHGPAGSDVSLEDR